MLDIGDGLGTNSKKSCTETLSDFISKSEQEWRIVVYLVKRVTTKNKDDKLRRRSKERARIVVLSPGGKPPLVIVFFIVNLGAEDLSKLTVIYT